jgi:hypothetical protein
MQHLVDDFLAYVHSVRPANPTNPAYHTAHVKPTWTHAPTPARMPLYEHVKPIRSRPASPASCSATLWVGWWPCTSPPRRRMCGLASC